jgi:DNA-binding transcriptional LysR family regulator
MRKARPHTGTGAFQTDPKRGGEPRPPDVAKANIPTDLLRTFIAICELGSFTKAAHLFGLTQPAVSAHMRRLESIIGADLIEKSLAGVTLTECGHEILRHARRMLSINDQIVSSGGLQPHPQVVRLGVPNLYAPSKLAVILRECGSAVGPSRLQVRCDHSSNLVRSIQSGYLDIAYVLGDRDEMDGALASWPDDLVWVRAPDFTLQPGAPIPLVSSPNLVYADRVAMRVLEKSNRRYEIVFTAFDTQARRSAAAAGMGYIPIPRAAAPPALVIETPGVLPDLPQVTMGIIAREDLDTAPLEPLISTFAAVLKSKT